MATSGGLNVGPGIIRNPDGSFSYNGKPIATGKVPPSMTYSPVNLGVPTFPVPGVGTPGAPTAPGGGPTSSFGPSTDSSGSSSGGGFENWLKANWKTLAKAAGLAITTYEAFKSQTGLGGSSSSTSTSGNSAKVDELTSAMTDIAKQQAGRATELFNDATPLRTAGTAALQQRLAAGPRAVPDLSGLVDNANPFSKNFTRPTPLGAATAALTPTPPVPPAAVPPIAPGAGPAAEAPVKDRIKNAWGQLLR